MIYLIKKYDSHFKSYIFYHFKYVWNQKYIIFSCTIYKKKLFWYVAKCVNTHFGFHNKQLSKCRHTIISECSRCLNHTCSFISSFQQTWTLATGLRNRWLGVYRGWCPLITNTWRDGRQWGMARSKGLQIIQGPIRVRVFSKFRWWDREHRVFGCMFCWLLEIIITSFWKKKKKQLNLPLYPLQHK